MADLSKAIQKYVNEVICLTQKDISGAAKSREWLLNRISSVVANRLNEPILYAARPFLYFGSYIKGTKVEDVDEFDVLVVIDSKSGIFSVGENTVGSGQGSANPNHKYDRKYKKSDDSGVSPRKMLNWLHDVVEEAVAPYGGTAPEKDGGQAVVATIASRDLKIDLVPAGVFTRTSDNTTFYNIPNGKSDNGWTVTNPDADIKRLKDAASTRSNLRNVIRLAKRINDCYHFTISSFAIETAVLNYAISNTWYNELSSDTLGSLRSIATAFRDGTVSDSYTPSSNLLEGVESLGWYANRLDSICEKFESTRATFSQDDAYQKVEKAFENQ